METFASSRVRALLTFAVTTLLVFGEFLFLEGVYHSGDDLAARQAAQTRVAGALASWSPGADVDAVSDAVSGLAATDAPRAGALAALTRSWSADPTSVPVPRLEAANTGVGTALAEQRRMADQHVEELLALGLLLVSLAWCVWFRRLVRRHRHLERAVTEKQVLDAGERRLLALVQNSADLVVVLDPDSTASFVSPSARSVLGAGPDTITGKPFVDLLAPTDVPGFVRMLAGSREGEQRVLVRMQHAAGRELMLEGTIHNLMADAAVNGWVLTVRDVTDRQAMQAELTYQTFHDPLTGLANRQLFADRLAHALRRRDGASEPLTVLLLDLDDFKHVNDSLGHGTGDALLVAVAERIGGAVREGDTAARLGGDEFAVLLENADREAARQVAERLLEALAVPVSVDGVPHPVRASIGMAEAVPGGTDCESTLRNADVAMYWAKDRGKGQVALYEAGLHALALDRLALRGELQRALREDQLVLHFQPTVDLGSGDITGFEALVRWEHPTRGLVPPADFIPVAEQSGLIVALGSWVLQEACVAGASLQNEWQRPSMSVNIAAQQLARADFVDEVLDVLRRTGMPADGLVLEMTESVLLDDIAATVASLTRLRQHGVQIAIDDFGTGYSSLSYLAQLPVDVLKVDKSFIDPVAGSATDTSLLEAIMTMSHSLRLTTVAEGVEQPEQAAWLQLARCSLGQGYLWSRPVELATARELLRRRRAQPWVA
jgi:diguanylate cyclase (GGDEF)-like protein/PAS domain S-box-containing protein